MEELDGIHLGALEGLIAFSFAASAMGGWMESNLGPWKGSSSFGCGPRLWRGWMGIHLGALEGLLAFRLRERFAGVHFGALDRQYPLVAVLGDGD